MAKTSDKLLEFMALKPYHFPVIKSIQLSQGLSPKGVYEQNISLVLARDTDNQNETLWVEFYDVRYLTLTQPDLSVFNVTLDIIKENKGPYIEDRFIVRDAAGETIWFECRDFDTALV